MLTTTGCPIVRSSLLLRVSIAPPATAAGLALEGVSPVETPACPIAASAITEALLLVEATALLPLLAPNAIAIAILLGRLLVLLHIPCRGLPLLLRGRPALWLGRQGRLRQQLRLVFSSHGHRASASASGGCRMHCLAQCGAEAFDSLHAGSGPQPKTQGKLLSRPGFSDGAQHCELAIAVAWLDLQDLKLDRAYLFAQHTASGQATGSKVTCFERHTTRGAAWVPQFRHQHAATNPGRNSTLVQHIRYGAAGSRPTDHETYAAGLHGRLADQQHTLVPSQQVGPHVCCLDLHRQALTLHAALCRPVPPSSAACHLLPWQSACQRQQERVRLCL